MRNFKKPPAPETLKYREVVSKFVDWNDLEEFVNGMYETTHYDFIADVEGRNDTSYKYEVDDKQPSDYAKKQLSEFIAGGSTSYLVTTILNDLCRKKLIPKGTYVIEVCW